MKVKSFQHRSKISEEDFSGLLHAFLTTCMKANKENKPDRLDHFFRERLGRRSDRAELNVFLNRLVQATGGKSLGRINESIKSSCCEAHNSVESVDEHDLRIGKMFLKKFRELMEPGFPPEPAHALTTMKTFIGVVHELQEIYIHDTDDHDVAREQFDYFMVHKEDMLSGEMPLAETAENLIHMAYLVIDHYTDIVYHQEGQFYPTSDGDLGVCPIGLDELPEHNEEKMSLCDRLMLRS